MPCSPGHVFYGRLQVELVAAGFDAFVEELYAPYYAARRGRPSLPPGRYFRMLPVGYFEGIDGGGAKRWRRANGLSLREFLRFGEREPVPYHSWLSRTRARLPIEVHDAVFTWVLRRLAEHGLVKGERIGVGTSTMEADAGDRAPRDRRGLPRDADPHGPGQRHRDAGGRGPDPAGPQAKG